MPSLSIEQLKQREATLKQEIAKQDGATEPAARRTAAKNLRRTQRRRRRAVTEAARRAVKPKGGADAADGTAPAPQG